ARKIQPPQIAEAVSFAGVARSNWAGAGRSILLDVSLKVVQDGLPPRLLVFGGERGFSVKRLHDQRLVSLRREDNVDLSAVIERERDLIGLDDDVISATEIKAHAAVFRLHPYDQPAAGPQIIGGGGCMPVL